MLDFNLLDVGGGGYYGWWVWDLVPNRARWVTILSGCQGGGGGLSGT